MNKKLQVFGTVAVSAILGISALTLGGCNGGNSDLNDSSVLNIVMPDLGYGTDGMKALASAFTEKTGHKANVDVTPTESGYENAIRSGTAPYDIYVMRQNTYLLVAANAANFSGEDVVVACLDDVYEAEVANEGIKFKDKMKDIYEVYNRVDAKGNGDYHYYAVQWCDSIFSLVRNLDVWQEDWIVPNTTDELLALCAKIKGDGAMPMIWSSQAPYMWSTANLWVSQYQGIDDMYGNEGFWNCYSEAGEKNSPKMWQRRGILYAMEVLDELVNLENGYSHTMSTSVDFTTAQGYFLIPSQKIAMMSNGDWLYKEMVKNYSNAKIEMMKTPVLSKIKDHPDCEGTIENDAELSALVKAIDAGSKSITGEGYSVSQKAFDKVYEARTMYTCGPNINHIMVSPSYSDSLDLVKQFYNFMASEEGLTTYTKSSGGFTLEFNVSDTVRAASESVANSFVKSTEALKYGNQVSPWPMYTNRLFAMGGMPVNPCIESGYTFPEQIFSLGKGYKNAAKLYSENYQNAANKWSSYLTTAGMA